MRTMLMQIDVPEFCWQIARWNEEQYPMDVQAAYILSI